MNDRFWVLATVVMVITATVGAYYFGRSEGYSIGFSDGSRSGSGPGAEQTLIGAETNFELAPNATVVIPLGFPTDGVYRVVLDYLFSTFTGVSDHSSRYTAELLLKSGLTSVSSGWISQQPVNDPPAGLSAVINTTGFAQYAIFQANPQNPGPCVVFLNAPLRWSYNAA
jgi:hypothetical protein